MFLVDSPNPDAVPNAVDFPNKDPELSAGVLPNPVDFPPAERLRVSPGFPKEVPNPVWVENPVPVEAKMNKKKRSTEISHNKQLLNRKNFFETKNPFKSVVEITVELIY